MEKIWDKSTFFATEKSEFWWNDPGGIVETGRSHKQRSTKMKKKNCCHARYNLFRNANPSNKLAAETVWGTVTSGQASILQWLLTLEEAEQQGISFTLETRISV